MASCGFIFDFIVVRVDAPLVLIENNKLLKVNANFNNINLKITSSRINVVEFKPRRSFEFDMSPEDLRNSLANCPFKLTVYYDSQVIGIATIPWQTNILEQISKNMGELTQIEDCELLSEDTQERVGVLEYVCRLQCKCEESSEETIDITDPCDFRRKISKTIDPHDILFVVAEPTKQNSCDVPLTEAESTPPTCASTAEYGPNLNLTQYRFLNGQTLRSTEVVNTCNNLDCCELMCTADQRQCFYDALNSLQNNGSSPSCKRRNKSKKQFSCCACEQSACKHLSNSRCANNLVDASHSCGCSNSLPSSDAAMEDFANLKNLSVCNMTAEEILKEFGKDKKC